MAARTNTKTALGSAVQVKRASPSEKRVALKPASPAQKTALLQGQAAGKVAATPDDASEQYPVIQQILASPITGGTFKTIVQPASSQLLERLLDEIVAATDVPRPAAAAVFHELAHRSLAWTLGGPADDVLVITNLPTDYPLTGPTSPASGREYTTRTPSPIGDELRATVQMLRAIGGFTDDELAAILKSRPGTVRSWLSEQRRPHQSHAERILAVTDLLERVQTVIARDRVPLWLRTPIRMFGGGPAIDLLKRDDLGQFDAVVESLEDPGAS